MSKTKTKQLGTGAALVIAVLSFGAFAGAAAIITKNQFSLAPATLAEDGEDESEDDGGDEEANKDEEDDNNDQEKEKEKAKKEQEKAREKAKKEDEKARESSGKEDDGEDADANEAEDENESEDENEDESEDENNGDDEGMYKDRDKTLEKLRKEIAKAREKILEKQAEGVDVTAALARLALAEESLIQVGASFDGNDLITAKMLAKQIKKIAHFAEKDLEFSKKVGEEMAKVEKRFGQVSKKISTLKALGGDASTFEEQLASLRADFSALQAAIAAAPGTITRDTVKTFEKRVKRLKNLVESAIFAYGGTDDDDLFEDHEEDADDLFEDLDDVAEIEDDDDNGVSGKVRKVAAEHKAAAQALKRSLEDIKDRSGLARTLFGPDFSALDTLAAQVAAMNARAAALESAAAQITDPTIRQILLTQADALKSEALKLQSYIAAEDDQFSIFGALLRLFR